MFLFLSFFPRDAASGFLTLPPWWADEARFEILSSPPCSSSSALFCVTLEKPDWGEKRRCCFWGGKRQLKSHPQSHQFTSCRVKDRQGINHTTQRTNMGPCRWERQTRTCAFPDIYASRRSYWEKLLFSSFNGNMTNGRVLFETYGLCKQTGDRAAVWCTAMQQVITEV